MDVLGKFSMSGQLIKYLALVKFIRLEGWGYLKFYSV